jgi:thiamine kinase-like enzyme
MFTFFGVAPLDKNEKLISRILYFCDLDTLTQARQVSRSWRTAVINMVTRKRIFTNTLQKCDYFTRISFTGFDLERLSGGLTNTTFKIVISNQPYVARLPGKQTDLYINRQSEYVNASIATQCGINAEIVYYDVDKGSQITAFLKKPVSMDAASIQSETNLKAAIQTLSSIHHCGKKFANDIDVFERNDIMLRIIAGKSGKALTDYESLREVMQKIRKIVSSLNMPKTACHNDTTPTNFVYSEDRMYLIDWEYSGNNYPIWDLVCLAMESNFTPEKREEMLKMYYGNPSQEIRNLFQVLMPVYEYWVSLWSGVQIANSNVVDGIEGLAALESSRLQGCQKTIQSETFKSALESLESLTANKVQYTADTNIEVFGIFPSEFPKGNTDSRAPDSRPDHAPPHY